MRGSEQLRFVPMFLRGRVAQDDLGHGLMRVVHL